MKNRCNNPKTWAYSFYGGLGITVCPEWNDSVESFYEWSMSHGYSDELTLDRIDCSKGYYPDNCRWVDRKVQGENKKSSIFVTWNNETHTLSDWSLILGIPQKTLNWRYHHWDIDRAFSQPLTSRGGWH